MTMSEDGATAQDGAGYGLTEGALVMTSRGPLAVEALRPGDRVVTRAGMQRLAQVEERTVHHARLMRVAASALGPDRPEADIVLAERQPILVRDWRAPALAGADRAMIPAARLADGEYIRAEARRDMRVFVLRFDTPAVIYAQGLELACEAAMVAA